MAEGNVTRRKGTRQIQTPEVFESRARQAWVPISKLFSDPNYQRPVDMDRVRGMASNFNPDAIGSIIVSKRTSGDKANQYAVLDGFHRVSLMKLFGWDDQKMPAVVYEGLSLEEEAELFIVLNKERTKPKPLHLFNALVSSGDQDATALAQVLINLGLSFNSYDNRKGAVWAIDTIQRVHKACGLATVRRALTVQTQAWGNSTEALNGEVFKGLSLLMYVYGSKVDLGNLVTKLKEHSPLVIRTRAKQMKEIMPEWHTASCMAAVLTQIYNFRLREQGRLPAWEGQGFPKKAMAKNPTGRPKAAAAKSA